MDEDYQAGLRGEMLPPITDPGYSQHELGLQRRAELQAAHGLRLARVSSSARDLGEAMAVYGPWRMLSVFLVLAIVVPLAGGIVIALLAAWLGGDVARAFEVSAGITLGLWILYAALIYVTYTVVRLRRWIVLAGGIVVAYLIVRQKT